MNEMSAKGLALTDCLETPYPFDESGILKPVDYAGYIAVGKACLVCYLAYFHIFVLIQQREDNDLRG